jgi:predicted ribosomally synthesized peptide with SipW-like signal peptide
MMADADSTEQETMNSIIKSLFVVVAVAAVAGGATYSIFTDTQTATGNTFSSGTLSLTTNNAQGVTHTYSVSNLKPGSWDAAGQVELKNTGSIDGHAWFEVKNIVQTNTLGAFVFPKFSANVAPWAKYGPSSSLNGYNGVRVELEDLKPGEILPVFLYATWPPTANDNDGQGGTATFDVVFHLDQK